MPIRYGELPPTGGGYAIRAALVTQTGTVYKLLLPRGHQRSAWRGQRSSWLSHKLRGAVTVLEGKARILADGSWNNTLYPKISAQEAKMVDVRLIPYYAWGNRGDSEMTVWIPLR